MFRVTSMDRWSNEKVSIEDQESHKIDQLFFNWFGHMKSMNEEQVSKIVYNYKSNGDD